MSRRDVFYGLPAPSDIAYCKQHAMFVTVLDEDLSALRTRWAARDLAIWLGDAVKYAPERVLY